MQKILYIFVAMLLLVSCGANNGKIIQNEAPSSVINEQLEYSESGSTTKTQIINSEIIPTEESIVSVSISDSVVLPVAADDNNIQSSDISMGD